LRAEAVEYWASLLVLMLIPAVLVLVAAFVWGLL
jgi:hypothetical protein